MTALLEALRRRAAETPHEPWLFGRRGVDWGWMSWAQALDQVARTARILDVDGRTEFEASRLPGAITLELAIVAAGGIPVPLFDPDAPDLDLAPVRSRLGRWTPETPPEVLPATEVAEEHAALLRQAESVSKRMPDVAGVGGRPLLLVDPDLDPLWRRRGLAWSLATGAAWAAEAESFFGAALWARPTVVVASREELVPLRESLDKKKRWNRLRAAILTDDAQQDENLNDETGEPVVLRWN